MTKKTKQISSTISRPFYITTLVNITDLVTVATGGLTGLDLTVTNALNRNSAKAIYLYRRAPLRTTL